MPEWTKQVLVVGFVASVVMFTNLGGPKLWDRDEPRNAGCALEMLQRHDWVTPVFNAELRTHKPVLLYWLIMSAYHLFGVTEFAARFWSAALGVGTALCTYAMGRRLFNGSTGQWAGVALATTLLFGVAGRAATPDSLLIFLSTLAITIYVWGTFHAPHNMPGKSIAPGPVPRVAGQLFPESWPVVAAMYAVMGLGVLAKGPVGLVLPTAVIGMFLLLMQVPRSESGKRSESWRVPLVVRAFHPKRFLQTCWSMRPLTAVAMVSAVALPWYIWVGIRTDGEFLRGFLLEHNFSRATAAMEGHEGGLWFYPVALLVGLFPWSVLTLPLCIDLVFRWQRRDAWGTGSLLAVSWVGVYVCLFSMAQTKLPSYITPCYPAAALLLGAFLDRWVRGAVVGSHRWRRISVVTLGAVGLVMMVALPIVCSRVLPGEEWTSLLGFIPLLGAMVVWFQERHQQHRAAVLTLATTAFVWLGIVFGIVAPRVSHHHDIENLVRVIANRDGPVRLASYGALEPSWVFYGGQAVEELASGDEPQWAGSWAEVGARWRPRWRTPVSELSSSPHDWLIITPREHLAQLSEALSDEFQILCEVPYFLRDKQLLLVGRSPNRERLTRQPSDLDRR